MPKLAGNDLLRLVTAIREPNPEQIKNFQAFYLKDQGREIGTEEASERLKHLAAFYALLRGHEWSRIVKGHEGELPPEEETEGLDPEQLRTDL